MPMAELVRTLLLRTLLPGTAAAVLALATISSGQATAQVSVASALAGSADPEICAFATSLGKGTDGVIEQLGVMAAPFSLKIRPFSSAGVCARLLLARLRGLS